MDRPLWNFQGKVFGKHKRDKGILRILDRLFGEQVDLLQQAMSRTAERQRLLVGNLANANTPGYKRKDLDFSVSLNNAEHIALKTTNPKHIAGNDTNGSRGFQGEELSDDNSITVDGNSVDLEQEIASLTETQLHFQALAQVSKRYFQGLKDVIKEGR